MTNFGVSEEMHFIEEEVWGSQRLGILPKITQLDSRISGIRTRSSLTLKAIPALSTTICFRQNEIVAMSEVFIVVEKQQGVLYLSKEKIGIVL